MIIGIDGSRAFLKRRTGIEEYSYQVIKHLRETLSPQDQVVLYVRKKIVWKSLSFEIPERDFELPINWRIRGLWAPRFWTQVRLSLEMLFRAPDVLFVPAHTVPIIHPKNTVVTIHGLEYEFCPKAYSPWERLYMRASIRFSCKAARTVICVSENTKRDVMVLYGTAEEKIRVISEGYEKNFQLPATDAQLNPNSQLPISKPYLLFIGRLEERKNIIRIIEAFIALKEKHRITHTLILAGKPGYGYADIRLKIAHSRWKDEIVELGYVTEEEKWKLLKKAEVFLFPTLYEGFGIPVLEAQSMGVPVVTSNLSSLPEVGGEGAVYVDPLDSAKLADEIQGLLADRTLRCDLIEKATLNVERFSWELCAQSIAKILSQSDPVLKKFPKEGPSEI